MTGIFDRYIVNNVLLTKYDNHLKDKAYIYQLLYYIIYLDLH